MRPIVDGLEEAYRGQLVVKRINANEGAGPALMQAYRIPGHPTILIFNREGEEIRRIIGPQPAEAIETVLQEILGR
jgi:thioredoxin-like negative regulator of GroEL